MRRISCLLVLHVEGCNQEGDTQDGILLASANAFIKIALESTNERVVSQPLIIILLEMGIGSRLLTF